MHRHTRQTPQRVSQVVVIQHTRTQNSQPFGSRSVAHGISRDYGVDLTTPRTQGSDQPGSSRYENDLLRILNVDIGSNTTRRIPAIQANETDIAPKPLDEREIEASNLLKFFQILTYLSFKIVTITALIAYCAFMEYVEELTIQDFRDLSESLNT